MNHNRRDFFKQSAMLTAALWNFDLGRTHAQSYFGDMDVLSETRLPILQGVTSETATQINVLADKKITYTITTMTGGLTVQAKKSDMVKKPYSTWAAYNILISDLIPGESYRLNIFDENLVLIDSREFTTLRPEATHARFAFASCMRDTPKASIPEMWASLEASGPDLLFLLGDNVYVDDGPGGSDPVTEEKLWRRYVETRQKLTLYKFPKLIPTLATWDDHDFGKNNTYGHTDWSETAKNVFRALYAQDVVLPEVSWGPGIATHYRAFGQQFCLMDDRSYREHQIFGNDHWGKTQENWLFDRIEKSRNAPAWILNGSQILGAYRTGWSLEHHPKAFKRVMNKLKALEAPVLFASGDVHYSEIMKVEEDFLGYPTLEITSSSMHSNAKSPRSGNARRMMSTGEFNFVITDVDLTQKGLAIDLRSMGAKGKVYFELEKFQLKRS